MGKKMPVIRTSEAGLFQKCPSVDIHSGVTLQQTYYLPFCHFGFSTTNLGPDSISAPAMSAPLTITQALSSLSPFLSGCVPSGGRRRCFFSSSSFFFFTALHPTLQKTLSTRFRADFYLFSSATITGVSAAANEKAARRTDMRLSAEYATVNSAVLQLSGRYVEVTVWLQGMRCLWRSAFQMTIQSR